ERGLAPPASPCASSRRSPAADEILRGAGPVPPLRRALEGPRRDDPRGRALRRRARRPAAGLRRKALRAPLLRRGRGEGAPARGHDPVLADRARDRAAVPPLRLREHRRRGRGASGGDRAVPRGGAPPVLDPPPAPAAVRASASPRFVGA